MQSSITTLGPWCWTSLLALAAGVAPAIVQSGDNPLGLKVHHITASVTDIDRATQWYREVLGFRLTDHGSRQNGAFKYAELQIPGFGVALVQTRLPAVDVPAGSNVRPSWVHIVFSVDDPERTFRDLKQRGVDVFTRGPAGPGPVSSFLIHDSEGNEIEIVKAGLP